jgi:hypothetical protein
MNVIMWYGRINTPNTARSNPNPRKRRIEKRENKVSIVRDASREWLANQLEKENPEQESKPVTNAIPEIVIQNGDGF